MFTFPHNLELAYSKVNEYPLPLFFTFVFTDQDGQHLYVACLKFYEMINLSEVFPVFQSIYGDEAVSHVSV